MYTRTNKRKKLQDAIKAAMDKLESYVLNATEAALKGSRAAILGLFV